MTLRGAILLALLITTGPAPAQTSRPRTDPALLRAVTDLASSDPAVRESAEAKLIAAGRDARLVLVTMFESTEDAQLRAAAGALLLRLPFDDPTDPPATRSLLEKYGQAPPAVRITYLKAIADAAGDSTPAILLRLMRDEPADEVRWAIVNHFRTTLAAKPLPPVAAFARAAALSPRAPNLALAGWATAKADPPAALALYRRCVDLEADQPTDDAGAAEFVFDALSTAYVSQRKYDDAAHVLRVQFARRPESVDRPEAVSNKLDDLFALHARFGPLAGFAADVRNHARHLARPQTTYALARAYDRRAAEPLVADALARAAWAANFGDAVGRSTTGEFLTNQNYDAAARAQLEAVIAIESHLAGVAPPALPPNTVNVCNAHLRLGLIAARVRDDAAAAFHKESALRALAAVGGMLTRVRGDRTFTGKDAEQMIWAEVHYHAFRAARARHDDAQAADRAARLLELLPDDEPIALEVLPWLVDQNRGPDAAKLFAKPYAASKKRLAEKPDDPERQNNLAWLCARAAQNLDEALALATRATAAKPDNYAYLDTLAEVHFRRGDRAKALETERRALALKPDDPFLLEQLKRFGEK
ncbi:MAG TPA: hypothetical protein VEA69_12015 [Tepidisphaeraceae bacterium]|nr:hypothetical protein [Tepidisphaeraceae bacterium]